jgi:hypothetical protein
VKNYTQRPEDLGKAVRLLRLQGVHVGLPIQKADGEMVFAVDDFIFTADQILELLDKNELNRQGIHSLAKTI